MTIRPQSHPFRFQPSRRGRFINQPCRNTGSEPHSALRLLSYSRYNVVQEGDTSNAAEVRATLIFNNKSGIPGADSVKVKAAITWVGVADGVNAEGRMYERLFLHAQPDAGGNDFIESLNPESLKVVKAIVEPSLANAKPDDKFQFERHGYLVADCVVHQANKPVFNLAVGLKDSWGK